LLDRLAVSRLSLAALLALACSSGGSAPVPDAGVDAPGSNDAAAADAAAAACQSAGDCPCFSNYDCPETHACTSLDDTGENVWCLEGPRGTGIAGAPCDGEADCASALCIEDDTGSFCSDRCEGPADCPDELPQCLFIGFGVDEMICAPP
jgi:hypothetical protein